MTMRRSDFFGIAMWLDRSFFTAPPGVYYTAKSVLYVFVSEAVYGPELHTDRIRLRYVTVPIGL